MKDTTRASLIAYNRLSKELDELYHMIARSYGISDSAFWLLYSLYEQSVPCSQAELCECWFFSRQTINSSLAGLQKSGFVTLENVPDNRKQKLVVLTDKGFAFAKNTVGYVMEAEAAAFETMSAQEQDMYLELTHRFIHALRKNTVPSDRTSRM